MGNCRLGSRVCVAAGGALVSGAGLTEDPEVLSALRH